MLVWCSRPAARASRRNRARSPSSGRNFSATCRLSDPWYASQTTPMPPRPISRTIRNSPPVGRGHGGSRRIAARIRALRVAVQRHGPARLHRMASSDAQAQHRAPERRRQPCGGKPGIGGQPVQPAGIPGIPGGVSPGSSNRRRTGRRRANAPTALQRDSYSRASPPPRLGIAAKVPLVWGTPLVVGCTPTSANLLRTAKRRTLACTSGWCGGSQTPKQCRLHDRDSRAGSTISSTRTASGCRLHAQPTKARERNQPGVLGVGHLLSYQRCYRTWSPARRPGCRIRGVTPGRARVAFMG